MKKCPWCGRTLETRIVEVGEKLRTICKHCGFKIKEEPKKPSEPKVEQPKVVPIKESEVPTVKPLPLWPFVAGAIAAVVLAFVIVRLLLS